jgi:hypothetical protein
VNERLELDLFILTLLVCALTWVGLKNREAVVQLRKRLDDLQTERGTVPGAPDPEDHTTAAKTRRTRTGATGRDDKITGEV